MRFSKVSIQLLASTLLLGNLSITNIYASSDFISEPTALIEAQNYDVIYKTEYEDKLRLLELIHQLDKNNKENELSIEILDQYDSLSKQALKLLNSKYKSTEDKNIDELINNLNDLYSELELTNLEALNDKDLENIQKQLLSYMNAGLPITIFDEYISAESTGYHKDDLDLLIESIEGSKFFIESIDEIKNTYDQAIIDARLASMTYDSEEDEYIIDEAYQNLLNQAKYLADTINPELLEEEPSDINTESDFYKNDKYRDAYLQLSKEERDIIDQMRVNEPTKKSFLTIDQVLSFEKYGLPVFRGDFLYPFMYDRNNNGMVGESYQEDLLANDEYLRNLYERTNIFSRYIVIGLDKDKDGYISQDELDQSNYELTDDNEWIKEFLLENKPSSTIEEVKEETKTISLTEDTASTNDKPQSIFAIRSSTRDAYAKLTDDQKAELDAMNTDNEWPLTVDEVRASGRYDIPVKRDSWLYPFMLDRNEEGMVGGVYYEDRLYTDNPNVGQNTPTTTTLDSSTPAVTATSTPIQNQVNEEVVKPIENQTVYANQNVQTGIKGLGTVVSTLGLSSFAYIFMAKDKKKNNSSHTKS